MTQLSFLKKSKKEHGGSLQSKGGRKIARPLDSRKPMHFVLKSKQAIVLFKNKKILQKILKKQAKTFGIKIYSETVQRDHWHLCLKITNRRLYRGFIRSLTGIIARHLGKGMWNFPAGTGFARKRARSALCGLAPYSRIVHWG